MQYFAWGTGKDDTAAAATATAGAANLSDSHHAEADAAVLRAPLPFFLFCSIVMGLMGVAGCLALARVPWEPSGQ